MDVDYKVLVLGAGASMNYGYPSGAQLRSEIISLEHSHAHIYGITGPGTGFTGADFETFRYQFQQSQMYSIDAFLAKRTEFTEIGKRAIAAVLLRCESREALADEESKDHWYQYLFNQLQEPDWDDLDFSSLAIVTFNYDRSLQEFLQMAMSAAYGKPESEVTAKLRKLRIVHVYGSLCHALRGEGEYFSYSAMDSTSKRVMLAASNLRVIPEYRSTDAETLVEARSLLREATGICFLGFGFDRLNVERLAAEEACVGRVSRPTSILMRQHCGSRMGVYDRELQKAMRILLGKHEPLSKSFVDQTCLRTLRETGFLLT